MAGTSASDIIRQTLAGNDSNGQTATPQVEQATGSSLQTKSKSGTGSRL